jgi:PAS domain S-box-containing protein
MAELSREISGSLDLDAVLLRVAHGVRELCGSDMSMIALREPGSGAMVVRYRVAARPDSYVGRRIEPGKGIGGQVLLTGRPFRSENILEDARVTRDYMQWDAQQASAASMAVPIRVGGDIEGLLYAQHRTPRRWTDRDEAILARLADHAVIAIQNARLFAREQEARAEAERAATALGASEEQYRALAEGSIQGMYIHQDTRIVFANRSMARILGYDGPEDLVGQHYLSVIAVGERARIEGYRRDRLAGRSAPTRYEAEGVRRDGSQIWIEVLVSVVPWGGRPAVLGTFLDITERKRAEEALRRSEQENARLFQEAEHDKTLLEQVFASTSDGILVLDLDGRVTALNRRGGELLGLMPDEAVGWPFARLAHQLGQAVNWHAPGGRALLELVEARVRSGAGDLEVARPEPRTLEWQATLRRDAMGTLVGLTFTFRDVTREREVSRMKSDFVSFVTHQLRTPLAGIKWMLELASQEDGLPEGARVCVQDAQEANERLIGLVNDLLDISRLEGGRLSVALTDVSLGELTLDVAGELAPLVKEKGHRLTVAGSDAVPPVVADPQLLRQVVLNLMANALKYTPPGGEIAVSLQGEGEVLWAVRDNGIGIPKEGQRRLFEKFYRADNAVTLETEGTGLGLYLVKLIVERFGGRIWCESEEGQGATFFVALPARR